ncbi:transcriptional repressor [Cyanobacterium stanieri LEGE 03274]|uniref:Transcriptional repressor n=1 Tax=Cyanobacterium stanieri LEGE 03274 TaxID=1828756 RepID=A0ABR9V6Q1_9CHRO|nr:Fur family transcriptional regulator [Cyanobacterium stanieri]MBE9223209.1 transcriptional repressor [Cyanobacterium stanieri LEGE 03274]
MRPTKNQQLILDLLQKIKGEISAQQIHFKLREKGSSTGLATVYRSLKALHQDGLIQERISSTGESLYSVIKREHHPHHLNCVSCGESIPLDDCPVDEQLHQWCASQKFTVYYHTLEFFGLCNECQQQYTEK